MQFLQWIAYIATAIVGLIVMIGAAVFTLLAGILTGVLALGGFVLAIFTIGVKEAWEARGPPKDKE